MMKLAPSILSADFSRLGEQIEALARGGAEYLHLDVMDGHFVPNISFGVPVVASLRKEAERRGLNLIFDAHLMIAEPAKFVAPFAEAGADIITFHMETCENVDEARKIIDSIRTQNKKAGVAINPDTPIEPLLRLANHIDMALIMSVNPGFGGQGFIARTLEKARILRNHAPNLDIQMDGGINLENFERVLESGVNIVVVGSAILSRSDIEAATSAYTGKR
ncbi:MAG: ribulose-phosphate 3-epimerase [Clostridiales bacterium]|nr:ribulose-phosphate 3-epimerase [Clostridiales bacterium]